MIFSICILYGCSVPVILRPCAGNTGSGEAYYNLIGDCYLYGMMDGEALLDDSSSSPQTFELR